MSSATDANGATDVAAHEAKPQPLDLTLVAAIREEVAAELTDLRRRDAADEEINEQDDAARAEPIIWQRLDQMARDRAQAGLPALDENVEALLVQRVRADLFGLGGFEEYLADPTIENIFVNGCDSVFVNRAGGVETERVAPIAESDQAVIQLVNRWASRLGRTERRFDVANPRLDLRLPGGYRLHAIMAVTQRPTVTIRCPSSGQIGLDELVELDTVSADMADFLAAAVRARCNIIIAGGTSTGKTTFLRALLREVPVTERIVVIEDTAELSLLRHSEKHENVVEMETRQANVEGVGEITMMDLTRECLRMSPDRVVVGEVRGAEALHMLKAMSQGNDGSMCTIHADSATSVLDRIRGYVAEGSAGIPMSVIDGFFGNAVDLVVHLRLLPEQRRRVVAEIVEVIRNDDDAVRHRPLYSDTAGDMASPANPPTPLLLDRLRLAGMEASPW